MHATTAPDCGRLHCLPNGCWPAHPVSSPAAVFASPDPSGRRPSWVGASGGAWGPSGPEASCAASRECASELEPALSLALVQCRSHARSECWQVAPCAEERRRWRGCSRGCWGRALAVLGGCGGATGGGQAASSELSPLPWQARRPRCGIPVRGAARGNRAGSGGSSWVGGWSRVVKRPPSALVHDVRGH